MKQLFFRLFTVLCISILFLPIQSGHAAAGQAFLHTEAIMLSDFPQVTVRFSAWDASGLPLEGLLPEHFNLSEDGGEVFHPDSLVVDREAPLQVVLAIDVSESMLGKPLQDAKAAAARFLDRLTPNADQVAVIAFSGELNPDPAVIDPGRETVFTGDLTKVYDLVEGLQAAGQSHLYQAAEKAARMFTGTPEGHRAVLLLSDGRNEPAEIGDPEAAIEQAKLLNIPFFVIGLGDQVDQTYLQKLAFETGGLFLPVPRSAELAELFNRMASLLKISYQLQYKSSLPADGKSHQLRLTLNLADSATEAQIPLNVPLQAALSVTPILATPTLVPTLAPTAAPTATTAPVVLLTPFPGCTSAFESVTCLTSNRWTQLIALVLILVIAILVFRPRKRKPKPEACAYCGFDLTGVEGPCPQCGQTKRLPKK